MASDFQFAEFACPPYSNTQHFVSTSNYQSNIPQYPTNEKLPYDYAKHTLADSNFAYDFGKSNYVDSKLPNNSGKSNLVESKFPYDFCKSNLVESKLHYDFSKSNLVESKFPYEFGKGNLVDSKLHYDFGKSNLIESKFPYDSGKELVDSKLHYDFGKSNLIESKLPYDFGKSKLIEYKLPYDFGKSNLMESKLPNDFIKSNLVESKLIAADTLYNSAYFSDSNSLMNSQHINLPDDPKLISCKNKKIPFAFNDEKYSREQLQFDKQQASEAPHFKEALQIFQQLDEEHDSEDEGIEDYKLGGYHPVHVGEVLQNRYVAIQKLGWGHFSTVWLSKDFRYDTYVAIKIQKSAEHYLEAAYDEVEILQKVAGKKSDQDCHVVQLLNSFIHKGPYGNHFCMVFEILGVNLLDVIKRYEYKGVPLNVCKRIAKQVLIGLDYLHRICGVIHTDLKPENVLLQLSKEEIGDIIENGELTKKQMFKERLDFFHKLLKMEAPRVGMISEKENLEVGKVCIPEAKLSKTQKKNFKKRQQKKRRREQQQQSEQSQQQYSSIKSSTDTGVSFQQNASEEDDEQRNKELFKINDKISFKKKNRLDYDFQVKIADLGNGCWSHHHFSVLIQTRQYRSPEVLLGMHYNETADMWSLACMLFELFTGDFLFEPRKGHHFSKNDDHLAQMQELVGKFPLEFSQRGLKSKRYFDKKGNLLRIPVLNMWSLKHVLIEKYHLKVDEAAQLASFIEPMLNPYPEKRVTALQSLHHPWLQVADNDSYTGKMTDEEYRQWHSSKNEQNKCQPLQREVDENDADRSESPMVLQQIGNWKLDRFNLNPIAHHKYIEHRQVEREFVDRSFTDLGYIGFGDGIQTQLLDSTANHQFINL